MIKNGVERIEVEVIFVKHGCWKMKDGGCEDRGCKEEGGYGTQEDETY